MRKSAEGDGNPSEEQPIRRPPARNQRRRTQQLVLLAQDLVEKRLAEDRASPTEVVAILRLGTESELANIERIKAQTEYLHAQRAKAEAEMLNDTLFSDAMEAIAKYQGRSDG